MKKITAFFALLMLVCMGAQAQTATLMEGFGDPLTLTQFKAMAGTGQRFGFVASSNTASATQPRCDHWVRWTGVHNGDLDETALFYLEGSESNYTVKRVSDSQYVITTTGSTTFGAEGTPFNLVNRDPSDKTAAVWGDQSISFEDLGNSAMHYNANAVVLNGGGGAWTTYAVFGPIWKVTVNCVDASNNPIEGQEPILLFGVTGSELTVTPPTIPGYTVNEGYPTSVTINNADEEVNITYASSSFDYTLVVNGAPEGTTIKIKDEIVSAGAVSFDSQVTQSDVVVTFPTEYEFYVATVTVDGTTITVNCDDPRWPVNFPKTQTFTRGDRHINSVSFNGQTVDGLYVNQSTLCYQDLTATKTVTLPVNTTVKPSFNVAGGWQHGFVYIDLNNDGDFTDEGELVAKSPTEGSPNLTTDIAEFTSPATEGTYRMRVKTDWASEDPGGNTDSGNYIINNGGQIVDLTIELKASVNVTYEVYDGSTLVGSTTVEQAANSTPNVPSGLITGYYQPAYDLVYSPETVGTSDCTITVNITPKEGVVTDLANLSNEKVYTLTTRRGAVGTNGSRLTGKVADPKSFNLVKYGESYYLWSESDSKWVKNDGTFTDNVGDIAEGSKLVVTIEGVRNGVKPLYFMGIGSNGMNVNDSEYSIVVNSWTTRDDGNEYFITESGDASGAAYAALDAYFNPQYTINYIVKDESGATLFTANDVPTTEGATITTLPEAYQRSAFYTYNTVDVTITESVTTIEFTATWKDDAPFVQSTSYDDATWYYATIRGSKFVRADENAKDGNGRYQTNNTNEETDVYKWAFIGNPYSNFWIANMGHGDGKYLYAADDNAPAMTAVEDPANTDAAKWEVISNGDGFNLRSLTGNNLYINDNGNTGCIGYWNSTWGRTDTGGKLTLTKILNDEEKYNELIALLESYELGDNLHQYNFEGYTASEATTAISNLKAEGYTPENMTAAQNLADAAKLNLPKAGMFLRIKSNAHGTYLSGEASTNPANRMTLTTEADANTIFYFDGNKMLTYGNGLYAKGRDVAKAIGDGEGSGEGVDYWFEESTITPAQYAIRFNPDGGSNRFLYAWGTDKNYADQNGADHVNCVFTLEEVKELPVTLHESETKEGYSVWIATFSAPVSVVSVEGAEIHKVSDTGSAFYCEPANVQGIPAGKGALLVTDTETATATVTLGETSEDFETILQPLYACEKGKAGLFFGKVEGSQIAGLYPIDSETLTGGFKAFVDDSTGEGKELVFDQDPTGIDTINNSQLTIDNGAIYNLQGQKVNKAQKGVFIQNGRKVVLK